MRRGRRMGNHTLDPLASLAPFLNICTESNQITQTGLYRKRGQRDQRVQIWAARRAKRFSIDLEAATWAASVLGDAAAAQPRTSVIASQRLNISRAIVFAAQRRERRVYADRLQRKLGLEVRTVALSRGLHSRSSVRSGTDKHSVQICGTTSRFEITCLRL